MTRSVVAKVVATIAVIAAAALVWHALPFNTQIYAPFDVRAPIGTPAEGRSITAKVEGAQLTKTLIPSFGQPIPALGTWVVVDTAVSAGSTNAIYRADLLVGPNSYFTSDRVLTPANQVQPGITDHRQLVFDVATDVLDRVDSVVLRIFPWDARLDSRLVLDIPLSSDRVQRPESVSISVAAVREAS